MFNPSIWSSESDEHTRVEVANMSRVGVGCLLLVLAVGPGCATQPEALESFDDRRRQIYERIDHLVAAPERIPCGASPEQIREEYGDSRTIEPAAWSEYLISGQRIGVLSKASYLLRVFPIEAPCEEPPAAVSGTWPRGLAQFESEFGRPLRTGDSEFWQYFVAAVVHTGVAQFAFYEGRSIYIQGRKGRLE
jgi:hypothetical protein